MVTSYLPEMSLSSLSYFPGNMLASGAFSDITSLLICTVSVLFGGVVGVFGSSFVMMAAVFGLAAFPQMATPDKMFVSGALLLMVGVEAALLWVSAKGAINYCPAAFSSQTSASTE